MLSYRQRVIEDKKKAMEAEQLEKYLGKNVSSFCIFFFFFYSEKVLKKWVNVVGLTSFIFITDSIRSVFHSIQKLIMFKQRNIFRLS